MILRPKLFTTLQSYNKKQFMQDITAGTIVGIVALPLAIAFAIASGVSPEKGLITAVIGGFIISFLGGSRVQIGGPTGAFIVIVYGIVQKYGVEGLTIATIMAGVILLILGFSRLGSIIKFIPHPVVVGFTSGIAVVIFSTQIKDLLGMNIAEVPSEFIDKWAVYIENLHTMNFYSVALAACTILIIVFLPKITYKIPGSIIAILITTILVTIFAIPVDTIESRFGEIPSTFSLPTFPSVNLEIIKKLIVPATSIAILGGIESLLSAVVADGMIGHRHRSNIELIAQGVANIVTPLFGGIPATGAIARTATNIKNGGRTPIAGITHALVLLLIMIFFGKWAKLIPMAVLAAILVIVSYNMSEWRTFVSIVKKSPKSDIAVLLTTFGITVIFDLNIAIQIGMILAVFLFMLRMSKVTNIQVITSELEDQLDQEDPMAIDKKKVPAGVEVFEISGPFFFGAMEKFKEAMKFISTTPKIRILRMRHVLSIDSTALHVLEEIIKDFKKHEIALILSGVHAQPLFALEKAGLLKAIGKENIFGNIDDALDRARGLLGLPKLGRSEEFLPAVEREM
jgi:SulP family sulfate permease